MSNSLAPDQDRHSVGPDLGTNHLQSYQQRTIHCVQAELKVHTKGNYEVRCLRKASKYINMDGWVQYKKSRDSVGLKNFAEILSVQPQT